MAGTRRGLLGFLARQARGLRKPAGVRRLDSERQAGSISLIYPQHSSCGEPSACCPV